MRISDWSSDVCSSDLSPIDFTHPFPAIEIIAIFAAIAIASGPAHDFNDLRPFDGEQLFIFCAQGSEPRRGDVVGSVVHPRSLRDFRKKGKSRMDVRSEEHTSELQSLMRISYAVFCLNKKK